MPQRGWMGVLALGLGGCGGGISGAVGGEPVRGLEDALFDQFNLFGFEITLLWLSDAPSSCELFEEVFDVGQGSCADVCAELATLSETYLDSEEHWTLGMTLRVDGDAEGTYGYDTSLDVDGFTADFVRWDVALWADPARCTSACEAGSETTGTNTTSASGGELVISDADDASMSGDFSLEFSDGGTLDGSFSATTCDMADWLAR